MEYLNKNHYDKDKKEDESVYDYNADGEVNNRDVVDLFRFVSTLH